jgi:ParB family chromosome partitioning protein
VNRSHRTRVERLRRDLKAAPPAVVVTERLPAKPKPVRSKEAPRKVLGKGLRALIQEDPSGYHGVDSLKSAEQRAAAPPIQSRRARGSSRKREQLGAAPAGDARGAISQAQEQPTVSNFMPIALKGLLHSELNVRKTDLNEDVVALAEDILEHGLLQNLVVVPSSHKLSAIQYQVVAGGRRLRALQHLWDEGKIDGDYMVACRVEDAGEGRSASLAENLHRIAMNPADEFIAFQAIVSDHASEEDPLAYCARRFRVPRQHVEERLRLAALAPEVMDGLRDGRVSVAAAKAYASFADHALQLVVFKAEDKKTWGVKHDPKAIRDAMKSKTYPAGIVQAVYVGLDAYCAAGGRTERELFMGSDEGERLIDPTLLDKLAKEKAEAELVKLAKRDGFQSGMLTQGFSQWPSWPPAPAGFTRAYGEDLGTVGKADRGSRIGVYSLVDGELAAIGMFKPRRAEDSSPRQTDDERRALQRREVVAERAARLAVPGFEGTPFEGRAKLPDDNIYFDHVFQEENGDTYVVVLVKVTPEEIEQHKNEAEAAIAAEEAAELAEDQEQANDHVAAAEAQEAEAA